MKTLRPVTATELVAIATDAAALALPPGAFGMTPASWNNLSTHRATPELELEIWAPAALALTAAVLYGATQHPLAISPLTVTYTNATDTVNAANHGLFTGDGPFQLTGTLPDTLALATDYWVIKTASGTFKLATSLAHAMAGTAFAFGTDGSGAQTMVSTASTQRVYWHTHDGLLGLLGDGAVTLTAQVGYRKRIQHSPRVIAYALVGTISAGTLSAAILAIQDSE